MQTLQSMFFLLGPVRWKRIGFAIQKRYVAPQSYQSCAGWKCWDAAWFRFYLYEKSFLAAFDPQGHCPDGKPCKHEQEWGHPCDRDEHGHYECETVNG